MGLIPYPPPIAPSSFSCFEVRFTPNGLPVTSDHPHGLYYGYPLSGTNIRFYGRIGGDGGSLGFQLDVNSTIVLLNATNFDAGPTLLWRTDYLGDGDHQLLVNITSLQQNGSVAVDYFEYVIALLYFAIRAVLQQEFCFQG